MKIAKIKNSKDSELSLVIENDDDLIAWGNLRTEKAVNAMCYCCSKYLTTDNDDDNDIMCDGTSIDLYSVAKKFTTDGMVIYSATDKKFYYDNVLNHDIILRKNGFREAELDTAYKFIYYPSKLGLSHTMRNAYGIRGLRESEVYEEADKPFELTKSDLDKIENYLKGTFEC